MDHLKHVHIFLAGLQALESPFPSTPSPSGLSPVAVPLPHHSVSSPRERLVRLRVMSCLLRVQHWAGALLASSHLTTPFQGGIRIQYLARNATRWSPPPMPRYNPSATYKIAFPACLQHEATARGEEGSLWAQQLAISSLDTRFS